MAFTNRSQLIVSIARWAQRDNLAAEDYDDFIQLIESHLDDKLRVQEMSARMLTSTVEGQFIYELPEDALGLRNIEIQANGRRYPLEYYTPEGLDEYFGQTSQGGVPCAYTLTGEDIEVRPCPNAEYPLRIVYYQRVDPLVADEDTNWVLQQNPTIYLYGGLHFLSQFVRDDEGAALWGSKFEAAVGGLMESDDKDRWSGSTPAMKAL